MWKIISLFAWVFFVTSCGISKFEVEHSNSLDLKGEESPMYDFAVVIYDLKTKQYFSYNDSLLQVPFTPASTFKIPNTLIGLETKVLTDSSTKLDLTQIDNPSLTQAFQRSIVVYYQELAKRIGEENMQTYLHRFHYGNEKISPELTSFWLKGDLRLSALDQIEFLYKIEKQQLGLRPSTYQTLMEIFELRPSDPFKLYGKTGWGMQDGKDIGWFVGFAQWGNSRYLFATVMTSPEELYGKFDFGNKRIDLTKKAFKRFFESANFGK